MALDSLVVIGYVGCRKTQWLSLDVLRVGWIFWLSVDTVAAVGRVGRHDKLVS